jgi:hypothetical protein
MWMQRLAATDQAGQGRTVLIASSSADGAGADAETGIQHVSMDMAAAGAINTRADLIAAATAGGTAHTLIDDVTLHMDSSGAGSAAAPISSYVHLGENAGDPAGMIASADGAGSSATLAVAGDVALSGQGDEVYVYNSGLFATGTNGGAASSSIGGDVSLISDGRDAHAYLLVQSSTDVAAGSSADVHVAGDVDLHSIGTEAALTRAAVRADGEGTVELDGHLNLVSDATSANSFLQVISQGAGHIAIDSIGMNVDGGGHGWMDLYTDHAGGLDIGSVDLSATAGSDVTLRLQHANDAADPSSVIDPTFLAHGDSTAALSIATANVGGAGDVHMFLDTQGFGTINEAASVARLDIHYQLADQDFAGIGATPLTTINGYKGEIIYNGVLADSTNFANAGSFSTLGDLNAGLDAALDGTHKYVFAVYGGSEDINGNGLADDQNAGVLAWDDNGTGMTSVVVLPGVTALTPNDIA